MDQRDAKREQRELRKIESQRNAKREQKELRKIESPIDW